MNLLARRSQIKLANDGVQMLKGKREALLKELISRARELRELRQELHRRGREAVAELALARAVRGTPEVHGAGVAGLRDLRIEINREKVWGLELSDIEQEGVVRALHERNLGQLGTWAHVYEAAEAAEKMLAQLIECAPVERNIQVLGEEVKSVSRRINALEEHLLPKLREEVRHIAQALDEREREDTFRLKRIKKKKSEEKRKKRES
jgi:V/A-type H+-transporting ATPase subunit D